MLIVYAIYILLIVIECVGAGGGALRVGWGAPLARNDGGMGSL
jgi:hypothetical protein